MGCSPGLLSRAAPDPEGAQTIVEKAHRYCLLAPNQRKVHQRLL
jgi:hypothetical protein